MTAATVTRSKGRTNRGLKGLAGALGFVCLVLFLLAIEQKQAVEAWNAVRDGAVPAVSRIFQWAADGASDGLDELKTAAEGTDGPLAATPNVVVLAGEFGPADDAARETTGAAGFIGAAIRLERGETFRTRPLRIAAGRDVFNARGETFANRLNARSDAQIELRAVLPAPGQTAVAASPLCGGARPGLIALLHRRDRVEMMIFRERINIGPDAAPDALCGAWSYRAR
ncbi:hypothetical protein [Brevundimonas sp.]|uniref:hypothetical protein n=1 Tax=Brevundimonas sp. TaxID=1871086 RepID=UPI003F6E95ED